MASPSCLARPRPQNFDPDPRARCRRTALAAHVRADPHSIPNMLAARGRPAPGPRISRSPYPSRAAAASSPLPARPPWSLAWRTVWGGEDSEAGLRRCRHGTSRVPVLVIIAALTGHCEPQGSRTSHHFSIFCWSIMRVRSGTSGFGSVEESTIIVDGMPYSAMRSIVASSSRMSATITRRIMN